jgi:hypothetical protein
MPFPETLEPASFKQTEVREAYQPAKENTGSAGAAALLLLLPAERTSQSPGLLQDGSRGKLQYLH